MRRVVYFICTLIFITGCTTGEIDHAGQSAIDMEDYKESVMQSDAYHQIEEALLASEQRETSELAEIRANIDQLSNESSEEPFVFFVIGDSELGMRGNTYPQLLNWIEHINNIESFGLEFTSGDFEDGESRAVTKPQLVFLAGDINKDRAFGFSLPGDANAVAKQETNQLFNQMDDDILFFPGNGNHDWDPYQWGDGNYGHNFGGLFGNLGTSQFVRSRFNRGLANSTDISSSTFNYDRNVSWFQPTTSAEFNYSFEYRGVKFTQLNQFLFQPAVMVSFESIFGAGPAWYFRTRSANWFQGLCNESDERQTSHVVVQHFPVNTGDGWWNDDLGGTPDGLRKQFMDIFEDSHKPVMFTGHNHSYRTTTIQPYDVVDHTSGYFANGYLMAVKASAEKGIYAVTYVNLNALTTTDPAVYATTYNIPQ